MDKLQTTSDFPEQFLGTWSIAGTFWGGTDLEEAVDTIRLAIENGWGIDTAPVYGGGEAETRIGNGLDGLDRPKIASKVGTSLEDGEPLTNHHIEKVRRQAAESIRKMGGPLFLLQIHWPTHGRHIRAVVRELSELQDAGETEHVGVCNFGIDQLEVAMEEAHRAGTRIASNQIPLNVYEQGYLEDGTVEFCRDHGIQVLAYSSIARGLLFPNVDQRTFIGDDMRRSTAEGPSIDPLFRNERLGRYAACSRELDEWASSEFGTSSLGLGVAWVKAHGAIPLIGARKPDQLRLWLTQDLPSLGEQDLVKIHSTLKRHGIETNTKPEFMRPRAV